MTLGSFNKLWIFLKCCKLIHLLLICCRWFFPRFVYGNETICIYQNLSNSHLYWHHLQFHKEGHYSDSLYSSLCSECTQPNPVHDKMSLTPSEIFIWLRWQEFIFLCKYIQIIVLVIKYPYMYNKPILWTLPLHCFCNQKLFTIPLTPGPRTLCTH